MTAKRIQIKSKNTNEQHRWAVHSVRDGAPISDYHTKKEALREASCMAKDRPTMVVDRKVHEVKKVYPNRSVRVASVPVRSSLSKESILQSIGELRLTRYEQAH